MIKHYLIITFRGLWKDKTFSLINIAGLALAVACCFLLLFWMRFELSFEHCYPYKNRIYKLIIEEKRADGLHYSDAMDDCSRKLKSTFPQIEAASAFCLLSTDITLEEDEGDGVMVNYADVNYDFLRMMAYEYVEGSPEAVFKNRGSVIMSEQMARKLYGKQSAIGKRFKLHMSICTIEAVVKVPRNTTFQFDLLCPGDRVADLGMQFVMLREGERLTPALEEQLSGFLSAGEESGDRLLLQPITRMHLHTPPSIVEQKSYDMTLNYGSWAQILYFSGAVLIILLMAVINYVNTSIARSMSRMREVGIRKVAGAGRRQLAERFLFEAFVISLAAVIVSLALVQYFFPYFSEIMGNRVPLAMDGGTIGLALLVCMVITLLAGGYSAFYLSNVKPSLIMKGGSARGTKDGLRRVLLGVQFFLSVSILVSTAFIYKQIGAIFDESTGMDRENIIVLDTGLWYESEDYITVIKQENPHIVDATMASCPPYNAPWAFTGVSWEGKPDDIGEIAYTSICCDSHYASTFGLELVDGRFIPPGLGWWQHTGEGSHDIVINESFARMMNVDNPVGTVVSYGYGQVGRVIGVVKDFNFKPLKEKTSPLFMSFNPEVSTKLYVKTTGEDKQATLEYILEKYKEMKSGWSTRPVIYHTVEDDYAVMYAGELRAAKVLSVFSLISFLLSLMGVFGMVSFMIEKRTKEIAIRKIHGAAIMDIVKIFCSYIIKVACVGTALSIPVCYLLLSRWLDGYTYRTSLSWWIFLLIPAVLIGITCIIVSIQVWLAARKNPVESLRRE